MKLNPTFHFIIVLLPLLVANSTYAQLDSLYTQQWNRDPITNLNSTYSAQRQIITAEQIRVSGYTQLSDIFQLIDGWTIKYDIEYPKLQSNGTGSYNHQNWVFMLNGQRIEMNRDPVLYVNQLAIPVYDIERIEIVNSNGMYLGEYTQNGLIHIITKKRGKDEVNIGGMVSTYSGSNYSIGYNKNKLHINGTMGLIGSIFNNNIYTKIGLVSGIEFQYIGTKISHQIQTKSLGENRDANYHLIGYLMQWNINEKNQIRLSSTANWSNPFLGYVLQIKNTLQHRYLKNHKKGNFIWQNGIGCDYIKNVSYFSSKPDYDLPIIKPYSSINIPVTRKINLFSDVQVAFAHDKIAPKLSVGMYKRVSHISNYSFIIAYTESLLEESFLTTVNQEINAIAGAPYYYNPKIATADLYYNLNFGNSVKLSFNSGLKNSYDLPDFNYRVFTNPLYFSGYYYTKRSTSQFNWINRINLHYDIVKNLVFDINYMHTSILNTWDENLRTIPKHKFTVVLQYDLKKRFTLWSRNYLQSKTQFLNYDEGYSLSSTKLPVLFSWDIGLSKKLWKDYIHLNLTARNIVISNKNYFNNSTPFSTSIFVSISANIDGIGKAKTTNP
jgi:hypothetical protein